MFWLLLAVTAVMIGIAIGVLLLWITSRFKFIFLGNLVRNQAEIVEPWKRHEALGNSLFLWRLCFAVACVVGVILVAVVFFAPAAGFSLHDALEGLSVAAGLFGSLGLVLFGVAAFFVALMTESFVIPIMYRYDMPVLDAWRAFIPWLKARPLHFVVYALFVHHADDDLRRFLQHLLHDDLLYGGVALSGNGSAAAGVGDLSTAVGGVSRAVPPRLRSLQAAARRSR